LREDNHTGRRRLIIKQPVLGDSVNHGAAVAKELQRNVKFRQLGAMRNEQCNAVAVEVVPIGIIKDRNLDLLTDKSRPK
jgi:hypothetical protein